MIEKIMKAVKSNNKKRGRNITVGAVVGMLLSCTAVMGAAEGNYLWIKNDNAVIEFSIDAAPSTQETWKEENPYSQDNIWEENTYVNNMVLFGKSNELNPGYSIVGCGLKLSGNLSEVNFINNSLILGAVGTNSTEGYGLYIFSSASNSIKTLTNYGSIFGASVGSYNLSNKSGVSSIIEKLINNGSIYGGSNGINNNGYYSGTASIVNLINNGSIYGGTFVGIYNYQNSGTASIGSVINGGVIYGDKSAIKNENGTIGGSYNYGILMSKASNKPVVEGVTIVASTSTPSNNQIANYGLAFIDTNPGYKNHGGSDDNHNFGEVSSSTVEIEGIDYIVRNVEATVNNGDGTITDIKSFKIDGGKLYSDADEIKDGKATTSNVILNGIEDTIKVSGT